MTARKLDIMADARGRWRGILPQLGIPLAALTGRHGPCPLCGGRDRFRFDDKDGNGTYFCNQCGAGNGMGLVMKKKGWDFRTAARRVRELSGVTPVSTRSEQPRGAMTALLSGFWNNAIPIPGTQADAYLTARGLRGVESPELRFHPALPLTDVPGRRDCPAMIARVTAPDGNPCALSRLYLDGDRKAAFVEFDGKAMNARKFIGDIPKGCAVRLSPHAGHLGVAEGVETGLAVERDRRVPAWALLNATMMENFIVPPGVRRLSIFGDNDMKFGGQKAAFTLAHRAAVLQTNPPDVGVYIPPRPGADWLSDPWA